MKKKLFILGLAMVMVFAGTVMVFATTYTSTISIKGNSTLAGETRSYVGATHKIAIVLSSMGVPGSKANYCNVHLNQKSLTGDKVMNSSKPNLISIGSTYSMTTNNLIDGKYYYFFSTQQLAGDGFTSKNTTMSSK